MKLIIGAGSKEIADLVLALQSRQPEQLKLFKDSLYGDGLFCLCQHFAVWYEQMKNGKQADFGAPCVSCRKLEECAKKNFPWDDFIFPILRSQGLRIQMGIQGHAAVTHTDPIHQDRDSH